MRGAAGGTGGEGIERRRFLQGAAVAWATPLILTSVAGPAHAQSCLPNGGPCDACQGMNCCDASGPADGGCCCSDANLTTECAGVCVAVDADCAELNVTPANDFICYAPSPAGGGAAGRAAAAPKGPKG